MTFLFFAICLWSNNYSSASVIIIIFGRKIFVFLIVSRIASLFSPLPAKFFSFSQPSIPFFIMKRLRDESSGMIIHSAKWQIQEL